MSHSTEQASLPPARLRRRRAHRRVAKRRGQKLIIVPLDGSELSERAIAVALQLARRTKRPGWIELVHVHTVGAFAPNAPATDTAWENDRAAEMRADVATMAQALARRTKLRVTSATLRGPAAGSIVAYATDRSADLIVMSTHGRSGVKRAFLGSVTEDVLHQSPIPVLVVPSAGATGRRSAGLLFRTILVPIDRASAAPPALRQARALGTRRKTSYTLFTAVPPRFVVSPPPYPATGIVLDRDQLARITATAISQLGRVAARARAAGEVVEVRVEARDQPAPAIVEAAVQLQADLIVLPTHQRSGLSRAFLGSVADSVVRAAAVPVLVFRVAAHTESPGTSAPEWRV